MMQKILEYKSLNMPVINPVDQRSMDQIVLICPEYAIFLKECANGGFFFNNALHLFGSNEGDLDFDIVVFNQLVKDIYKSKVEDYFFFAADLFGNLFAFRDSKVYLFFIDSGEFEFVSNNFEDWVDIVINEPDYYIGYKYVDNADALTIIKLSEGYRMGATLPFVLGGAYSIENLRLKHYKENLYFNASIASQISDLPDGTPIVLDIKNT
jgi:hypothetical protein